MIDREFNFVENARGFVEKYNKDKFTNFVKSTTTRDRWYIIVVML